MVVVGLEPSDRRDLSETAPLRPPGCGKRLLASSSNFSHILCLERTLKVPQTRYWHKHDICFTPLPHIIILLFSQRKRVFVVIRTPIVRSMSEVCSACTAPTEITISVPSTILDGSTHPSHLFLPVPLSSTFLRNHVPTAAPAFHSTTHLSLGLHDMGCLVVSLFLFFQQEPDLALVAAEVFLCPPERTAGLAAWSHALHRGKAFFYLFLLQCLHTDCTAFDRSHHG